MNVKFIGIPRQRTRKYSIQFVSVTSKLSDLLEEVVEAYDLGDILLTETGQVRPYVRILVNGRSFQFVGDMDTELHDGDTLALIYPWLGHEDF